MNGGAETAVDTRRTNATRPSRGALRAESDVSTAGDISVTGNTGTQVFLGVSTASKTGQNKSGSVYVTSNKGSQVFCGPSGSSSASGAGKNKPGGFTVIGNKGVQLCITSSRSSSTSSESQSGCMVISENENLQLLSDGSTGDDINVCRNQDLQLLHGTPTPGMGTRDVIVQDNEKSQVFIPQRGGEDAYSEMLRDEAEEALESITPEDAQD